MAEAALLPGKDLMATESSGHLVACHRFDRGPRGGVWSCNDEVMRDPNSVRRGLGRAAAALRAQHRAREHPNATDGGAAPALNPLAIILFAQVANALLLPLLAGALLLVAGSETMMGEFRSGPVLRALGGGVVAVTLALSLHTLVKAAVFAHT